MTNVDPIRERLKSLKPVIFPAGTSDAERTVPAALVAKAFGDPRWSQGNRRFVLDNAIVVGALTRRHLTVVPEVEFRRCVFQGKISLPQATFDRGISFLRCRLEAALSLSGARLPSLHLAMGTTVAGDFDLDDAHVDGPLDCDDAVFDGDVSLLGARITGWAWFERAHFRQAADLRYLHVDVQLGCDGAKFGGAVTLEGATLGDAYFDGAEFGADLDCGRLTIGSQLSFQEARFREAVNLNGLVVGGEMFLDESRFDADVDFGGARVTRQLSAQQCLFKAGLDLNGSEVGDAFFTETSFRGKVELVRLTVKGQLVCDHAAFGGDVDVSGARAADVFLDDTVCECFVNLSGCVIDGDLVLAGAWLPERLDLSYTTIGGSLSVFKLPDGPEHERATTLPVALDLRGLTYKRTDLETDERRTDWVGLWRGAVSHEPQPYLVLEQVLRSGGRENLANEVHYEMRLDEGRRIGGRLRTQLGEGRVDLATLSAWLWNWFLRVTVGYGVYGYRLGFWILGVLAGATVLADLGIRYDFIEITPEWKGKRPLRFLPHLYALDSFLPVVGLNLRKYWMPVGWVANQIAALLLVLGWVTVPLVIALISGALKKRDPR